MAIWEMIASPPSKKRTLGPTLFGALLRIRDPRLQVVLLGYTLKYPFFVQIPIDRAATIVTMAKGPAERLVLLRARSPDRSS